MTDPVAGNLRIYSWFLPLSRIHFWTPVFFLYFAERFSIEQVLLLESIYYATVVLFEVPSGYFSDRVGRKATLLISAAAMVGAHTLFLVGGTSFALFALAQAGQAMGYAFLSATDTSLHYDSLAALGRESEYGDREARLARNGYLASAVGVVVSGLLCVIDLRIAYALALGNGALLLGLATAFREPPRHAGGWAGAGIGPQLAACMRQLRKPLLLWVFAYFVLKITLEHVPYEFAQPYLAAVLGEPVSDVASTPAVSGLLYAVVAAVGSVAASQSMALRRSLGLGGALLGLAAVQTVVISAMAAVISPLVIALLALRSCQAAIANVIIHAEVTPRLPQSLRATYLSLHSLAGRLGYALVLAGLSSLAAGHGADDPTVLRAPLAACAIGAAAGTLLLGLCAGALREKVLPGPAPSR